MIKHVHNVHNVHTNVGTYVQVTVTTVELKGVITNRETLISTYLFSHSTVCAIIKGKEIVEE